MFRSNYFKYLNGNYIVQSDRSGAFLVKRCLRYDEDLISEFPDSIDLKITNKCSWGCPYCHESSVPGGESFNLERTIDILSQLPDYPIEIAIGGGNVLEIPEKTLELVKWINNRGLRPRLTINYQDTKKSWGEEVNELMKEIDVIGISMNKYTTLDSIKGYVDFIPISTLDLLYKTRVIHVIAGIIPPEDLLKLATKEKESILILGYKQWGRASGNKLPDMTETKEVVKKIINNEITVECLSVGFDNLALAQLGIKELVPPHRWRELYMGEEGSHSMYIDAVKEEFAVTSRSPERTSWKDIKLLDYYAKINNRK